MPFERPSLTTITDRIQSDIETRNPTIGTLLRRSVLKVLVRAFSGSIHLLYGYLDFKSKQIQALTADEQGLEDIATEYGISREAAAKATGTATVTGTTGTSIPSGSRLQTSDGIVYVTDEDETIASGTATLDLTAEEAGSDGNNDGDITLTFISPITSVSSTATVSSSGLSGGSDEETNDSLRERVLIRKRQPPHGGADFDYVTWAKEVSGVTRAWTSPHWNGIGTIGLVFVRDNDSTSILPTSDQAGVVFDYLESHTDSGSGLTIGIPVGALAGLTIFSSEGYVTYAGTGTENAAELTSTNMTIQLYPNTTVVQAAVEAEIEALFLSEGGSGETVPLSKVDDAISAANGEIKHRIISPTDDISAAYNQIHSLGTITWQAYV